MNQEVTPHKPIKPPEVPALASVVVALALVVPEALQHLAELGEGAAAPLVVAAARAPRPTRPRPRAVLHRVSEKRYEVNT